MDNEWSTNGTYPNLDSPIIVRLIISLHLSEVVDPISEGGESDEFVDDGAGDADLTSSSNDSGAALIAMVLGKKGGKKEKRKKGDSRNAVMNERSKLKQVAVEARSVQVRDQPVPDHIAGPTQAVRAKRKLPAAVASNADSDLDAADGLEEYVYFDIVIIYI